MGWLAYDMTASPFLIGALMGTRSVPLGSLLAGTLAEFYGSPFAILLGGISVLTLVRLMTIKIETLRRA